MEEDPLLDASLEDFAASSRASPEPGFEYQGKNQNTSSASMKPSTFELDGNTASQKGSASPENRRRNESKGKANKGKSEDLSGQNSVSSSRSNAGASARLTLSRRSSGLGNSQQKQMHSSNEGTSSSPGSRYRGRKSDFDAYLDESMPGFSERLNLGLPSGISLSDLSISGLPLPSYMSNREDGEEGDSEGAGAGNGSGDNDADVEIKVEEDEQVGIPPHIPPSTASSTVLNTPSTSTAQTSPSTTTENMTPTTWSPPGYGYSPTFRKRYMQHQQSQAQQGFMSNQIQYPRRKLPFSVDSDNLEGANELNGNSDSAVSEAAGSTAGGVYLKQGPGNPMSPPKPRAAITAGGNQGPIMFWYRNQYYPITELAQAQKQNTQHPSNLSSRENSVENDVRQRTALSQASPGLRHTSLSISPPSSRECSPQLFEDAPERRSPARDLFPVPSLLSPKGATRNLLLNRNSNGGYGGSLGARNSRGDIISPNKARSRSQSISRVREVSTSPAKRQENMRAQSPSESLRRLKSVSPARPHTQHIYNYAAQLIKDSPPPPPLPPSPSTIASPGKDMQSPLQRKGGQVNVNSQAGAGSAEGQQGPKDGNNGFADEDRESTDPANIPLPRGSSSISPSPGPEMFRGKGIGSLSMANRMRSSHSPIFAREASWSCSPPPAESIQERLMRGNLDPHGVKERSPLNNSVEVEPPHEETNTERDPGLPNFVRFAMSAEVQHREPLAALSNWISSIFVHALPAMTGTRGIGFILITGLLIFAFIRTLFVPPTPRPVPDLVKLSGLARSFEPLIYYSENGVRQIGHLQETGVAVWDLGESMRNTNMTSGPIIVRQLDELSESLTTLSTELTRFFANVDADVDSILLVMDWAKRELETLSALPPPGSSLMATALDNLHSFFGRIAVLERIDPAVFEGQRETPGGNGADSKGGHVPSIKSLVPVPTALGSVIVAILGPTRTQHTHRTLTHTFAEFLSVLEDAITSELTHSAALFVLFESIDRQFLNLARTVIRESDVQEQMEGEMLSSLWTRVMGPNAALVRKYEKNRRLLASVRARTVANKGLLLDCRSKLLTLKVSLEALRRRLVKPLLQAGSSGNLAMEDGTTEADGNMGITGQSGKAERKMTSDDSKDTDIEDLPDDEAEAPLGSSSQETSEGYQSNSRWLFTSSQRVPSASASSSSSLSALSASLPGIVENQIKGLQSAYEYLHKLRERQKNKLLEMVYGSGSRPRAGYANIWKNGITDTEEIEGDMGDLRESIEGSEDADAEPY